MSEGLIDGTSSSATDPTMTPDAVSLGTAEQTLVAFQTALATGNLPRSRQPLVEAVRVFRAHDQPARAANGLVLLAEMEARRDNLERALTHARSAFRLVRAVPSPDASEAQLTVHELLSELHSHAGELAQARKHAEWVVRALQSGDGAGDAGRLWRAARRLALLTFCSGDVSGALSLAYEARDRAALPGSETAPADALLATLLLHSGLPTAAEQVAMRALKHASDALAQGVETELLVARGVSRVTLGRPDQGARDFRRLLRSAKEREDARTEALALATGAVAEAVSVRLSGGQESPDLKDADLKDADTEGAPAKSRVDSLAGKAEKRLKRFKDPVVSRTVRSWISLALKEVSLPVEQRQSAADRLVALARESELEPVVAACLEEVQRLATLPAGAPVYHLDPAALPLPL